MYPLLTLMHTAAPSCAAISLAEAGTREEVSSFFFSQKDVYMTLTSYSLYVWIFCSMTSSFTI